MNLARALRHLEQVGVTADVLAQGGVDPTDPGRVRAEVEQLLVDAAASTTLTSMAGLARLQQAYGALLTADEVAAGDALSRLLHRPADLSVRDDGEVQDRFVCLAEV